MCGRYALHANPEVVALQFALDTPPQLATSYNICPGREVLVVRENREGRRTARTCRWGLIPHWAKDASIGNRLANARAESVGERPAFREAFRSRRCLVPASGFYEWQKVGTRKQPWYFWPADAELFALAGIASVWNGIRTVALLTTGANPLMERVHDRMPVIVAPEDYAAWLEPQAREATGLLALLRPYAASRMRAHAVHPRVNRPEHDDQALIAPADADPQYCI